MKIEVVEHVLLAALRVTISSNLDFTRYPNLVLILQPCYCRGHASVVCTLCARINGCVSCAPIFN